MKVVKAHIKKKKSSMCLMQNMAHWLRMVYSETSAIRERFLVIWPTKDFLIKQKVWKNTTVFLECCWHLIKIKILMLNVLSWNKSQLKSVRIWSYSKILAWLLPRTRRKRFHRFFKLNHILKLLELWENLSTWRQNSELYFQILTQLKSKYG